jgi:hypothetical protein
VFGNRSLIKLTLSGTITDSDHEKSPYAAYQDGLKEFDLVWCVEY